MTGFVALPLHDLKNSMYVLAMMVSLYKYGSYLPLALVYSSERKTRRITICIATAIVFSLHQPRTKMPLPHVRTRPSTYHTTIEDETSSSSSSSSDTSTLTIRCANIEPGRTRKDTLKKPQTRFQDKNNNVEACQREQPTRLWISPAIAITITALSQADIEAYPHPKMDSLKNRKDDEVHTYHNAQRSQFLRRRSEASSPPSSFLKRVPLEARSPQLYKKARHLHSNRQRTRRGPIALGSHPSLCALGRLRVLARLRIHWKPW